MRINIFRLAYFLLLFPFFEPVGLSVYSNWHNNWNVFWGGYKTISLVIILCIIAIRITLIDIRKKMLGVLFFALFGGIYIYDCLLYNSPYFSTLINFFIDLAILILSITVVLKVGVWKNYLNSLHDLSVFFVLLHLTSMVYINVTGNDLFSSNNKGDYYYLFGSDNYSMFYILPMLGIILYRNSLQKNKELFGYILILFTISLYLYTRSIASFISVLYFFILVLIAKRIKVLPCFFSSLSVIFFTLIFLFLVIFYSAHTFFLDFLTSDFLGKGIQGGTLNSRTIIWEDTIKLIIEKPFWGYGNLPISEIENYVLYGANHSHNLLLELLLRTGVIGGFFFIVFVLYPFRFLQSDYNFSVLVLKISVSSFMVLSIFDSYPLTQLQYFLFGLAYAILYQEKEKKS